MLAQCKMNCQGETNELFPLEETAEPALLRRRRVECRDSRRNRRERDRYERLVNIERLNQIRRGERTFLLLERQSPQCRRHRATSIMLESESTRLLNRQSQSSSLARSSSFSQRRTRSDRRRSTSRSDVLLVPVVVRYRSSVLSSVPVGISARTARCSRIRSAVSVSARGGCFASRRSDTAARSDERRSFVRAHRLEREWSIVLDVLRIELVLLLIRSRSVGGSGIVVLRIFELSRVVGGREESRRCRSRRGGS